MWDHRQGRAIVYYAVEVPCSSLGTRATVILVLVA